MQYSGRIPKFQNRNNLAMNAVQNELDMVWLNKVNTMNKKQQILLRVEQLLNAYNNGILGGEKMPEHENYSREVFDYQPIIEMTDWEEER